MSAKEQELAELEASFRAYPWRNLWVDFNHSARELSELTEHERFFVDTVACWLGRLTSSAQLLSSRLYIHPDMTKPQAIRDHLRALKKNSLCFCDWLQKTSAVAESSDARSNCFQPWNAYAGSASVRQLVVTYSAVLHIIGSLIDHGTNWMKQREKVVSFVRTSGKLMEDHESIKKFLVVYGQVYCLPDASTVHVAIRTVFRDFMPPFFFLEGMGPDKISQLAREQARQFCDLWQVERIVFEDEQPYLSAPE